MKNTKYIIGIDLGTTNCTMAYVNKGDKEGKVVQFEIPQMTAPGVQSDHLSLPSFIYFPLPEELKAKMAGIEWDKERKHCIGIFASERGKEIPSRLIGSAKSWLCHSGINRREKLLPAGKENHLDPMSPLEACSQLLLHLKESWDFKMPGDPFQSQQVLITVPASFDPSARQLVQEAAQNAGYPTVILLEEPQAAFYSWLLDHQDNWRQILKVNDTILVIDIGGGTTDFSLISVEDEKGDLVLRRIAVGTHLLLGGDNIDLALAYFAKKRIEEQGHSLDDWQFQSLIHVCRQAKEVLMGENPPDFIDISVLGRGSKLIGGSLKTTIQKKEIEELIVDGFIPLIGPEEMSLTERRTGIQQIGLPYAQDARLSSQLAKFLSLTGEIDQTILDKFIIPTKVLFNGGTMKSQALRQQLVEVLNKWADKLGKQEVKVLTDPNYDFAVSRGAANYGMARDGKAVRIKSGAGQSYFIAVEEALPAVPGIPPSLKAVCIVPFGMEEGSEKELDHQEFALVLGEPATFRFFSHSTQELSNGAIPTMGTAIKNWKSELKELHPIESNMERGVDDGKTIRVKLKSKITELGVLELWCAAPDGRQWKLEFDIRK